MDVKCATIPASIAAGFSGFGENFTTVLASTASEGRFTSPHPLFCLFMPEILLCRTGAENSSRSSRAVPETSLLTVFYGLHTHTHVDKTEKVGLHICVYNINYHANSVNDIL